MTDPWVIDPLHITIRLVLAVVLGGLIGLEREQKNHAAGFRTHILVCLGSALIMLLSIYGFSDFINEASVRIDPARLAAQVVSGIGFLGAGAIIRNGLSISGLTTAASLWVVAAIGLAIGAGFYYGAVASAVFVFISLWFLKLFEKRWFRVKRLHVISIRSVDRPGQLGKFSALLDSMNIEIRKVEFDEDTVMNGGSEQGLRITLTVKLPNPRILVRLTEELRQLEGVTGVTLESI